MFAAFSVVLGTLVVQGFTIGPLVKLLGMKEDGSFQKETHQVRQELLTAGIACLNGREMPAARNIQKELVSALDQAGRIDYSAETSTLDQMRKEVVAVQRTRLIALRESGKVQEDVFRLIEQELDWAALAASASNDLTLEEI